MLSPVKQILDDCSKLARDLRQELLNKLLAVLVDEPGADVVIVIFYTDNGQLSMSFDR